MQVDFILEQRRKTIEGFTKGMRLGLALKEDWLVANGRRSTQPPPLVPSLGPRHGPTVGS